VKQRIRLLVAAHADHADQAAESAEAARARPQPTRPSGQTALSPDTESDREQAAFLSEMAPNAEYERRHRRASRGTGRAQIILSGARRVDADRRSR
jgi:hypothetical protein